MEISNEKGLKINDVKYFTFRAVRILKYAPL